MRCFTKRRHIKPHQGIWNSCLERAAGDHMFIFYHEDKAMGNSVKHFKIAKRNRYHAVKAFFSISFWLKSNKVLKDVY